MIKKEKIIGVSGSRAAYYINNIIKNTKSGQGIIIVDSNEEGERLKDDLSFFRENVYFLKKLRSSHLIYDLKENGETLNWVKGVLSLINGDDTAVIIESKEAFLKFPNKARLKDSILDIKTGYTFSPNELFRKLINMGYNVRDFVESSGEISKRGDIIDVFTGKSNYPFRIEFFGDEIDSIRIYDETTQRSIKEINYIRIEPVLMFLPTNTEIDNAVEKIKKEIKKDDSENEFLNKLIEVFAERENKNIYFEFPKFFDSLQYYIWEYLTGDGKLIINNPKSCFENIEEDNIKEICSFSNLTLITPFADNTNDLGDFTNITNEVGRDGMIFSGNQSLFNDEVNRLLRLNYKIIFVAQNERDLNTMKKLLYDINLNDITYNIGYITNGMILENKKIAYISYNDIYRKKERKKAKSKGSGKQLFFSDLKRNDFIVHDEYGIGIFRGLETVKIEGKKWDLLKVEYSNEDFIYLATSELEYMHKYIGNKGENPKLSSLYGPNWKKVIKKAKEDILKTAKELINIYAKREIEKGYAFLEDSEWQEEFELDFPYEETEDQLKAIDDVKKDMENDKPMDRLICGDVGYGKTEVAARAIFKCVEQGKQSVILTPTTLLANQHFNTFKERFQNFPFKIDVLSRFKNKHEQEEAIEKIKSGKTDIIIGTHRLLSNDVEFHDIGLLVIDEEHRFGVKHKEKIKKIKGKVDVLTLSATPIPRTLNMALQGIRDISMINEPPRDRIPVETFVMQESDETVKEAVMTEIKRGGQVFLVKNRINGIFNLKRRLTELCPNLRIEVIHGRMKEDKIEDIMYDFISSKIDVLISTTIIENGLDIPNANTIIIMNADKYGLAQLYQLRGRVGRSYRNSFAYLLYDDSKKITDKGRKRMLAIKEFTEFGSGFKIAMRDLEIRGAGNILGVDQHGEIAGIGYELYCREMEKTINELKENIIDDKIKLEVNIQNYGIISSDYIENEDRRLEAYKLINGIKNKKDKEDVIDTLIDVYGDIPREALMLVDFSYMESQAKKLHIKEINEENDEIEIKFESTKTINEYSIFKIKEVYQNKLTIVYGKEFKMRLYSKEKSSDLLEFINLLYEFSIKGNKEGVI